MLTRTLAPILVLAAGTLSGVAAAQTESVQTIEVDVPPSLVTVYRDRARVARQYRATLAAGEYDFHFGGLPDSAEAESVQAQCSGARVSGVAHGMRRLVARGARPESHRIDLERQRVAAADDQALVETKLIFLDHLAQEMAAELAGALDAASVDERMAFLAERRSPLLARRRAIEAELTRLDRELLAWNAPMDDATLDPTATVSLIVDRTSEVTLTLSYFVSSATWSPRYSIRASRDGSSNLSIEYDAVVSQQTGEDWTGVELVLSTALRAVASQPPILEPWFLDVSEPPAGSEPPSEVATEAVSLAAASDLSAGDPAVTFVVPRRHSVPDGARDERARIATIDGGGTFIHVAVPLLNDQTFVRAAMHNRSGLELLPGPASLFIDQDYVGQTRIENVPPHGRFQLYFGSDPAVMVRRALLESETSKTGLLGGGRRTIYDYGITIENRGGKAIALELWDRIPASLAESVEVILSEISQPVDNDAAYVEGDRSRGLLRWTLDIPAAPTTFDITYRVEIVRPKDVEVTHVRE